MFKIDFLGKDIVAIILILCCTYLYRIGINTIILYILLSITAYYFVVDRLVVTKIKKMKKKNE